jgi:very-short-patch-repair endonuclease
MPLDKSKRYSNLEYNKALKPFARALRSNMTKAEACLWKYALRGKQIDGYGFRRQRPVLNYIADFMCPKLKLIIEVDGITHHDEQVQRNDLLRQRNLEAAGFTVIRFDDDEVLTNMEGVIASIKETIKNIESSFPPPAPS